MKIKSLQMPAMVYKKLDPTEYNIEERGEKKQVFSYSVLLDVGENVETFKVKKELYEELKPYHHYIFNLEIDTSAEKEKDRYKVLGVEQVEPLFSDDCYIFVSKSEFERLSASSGKASKPDAKTAEPAKPAEGVQK